MGMIRAVRMMNGLVDGTIDGTALETLLTTNGREGDFTQLLSVASYTSILMQSNAALNSILVGAAASAKAKTVIMSLPNVRKMLGASAFASSKIIASATATALFGATDVLAKEAFRSGLFAAIATSATATKAFLDASVAARQALYDDDEAMGIVFNNTPAREGMRTMSRFTLHSSNSEAQLVEMQSLTARSIVFGIGSSYSTSSMNLYFNNRSSVVRPDSVRPTTTATMTMGGGNSEQGSQARIPFVAPIQEKSVTGLVPRVGNSASTSHFAYLAAISVS